MEESAGKFACLLYDSTLKTVLGSVANEELYIGIIEFLLPGKHIDKVTKLDKEKHGLVVAEKTVIFDLLCRDADTGEEFLVEVQNASDPTYKDRVLYYSTVPLREQMEKKQSVLGEEANVEIRKKMDYSLRPVYVISLLNFTLKHDSPAALEEGYVSRYELRNRNNSELMTEALHFVFLEMGRLPYGKDEWGRCRSKLEKFIFLFKFVHTFEQLPAGIREDELLGMLAGAAEFANMSVLQKEEYDKAMKDEFARLVENNYAWSQGKEEGREEGREEERAEAAKYKLETARKLLKLDVPIETVVQAMGLSPEQVEALRG